MRLEDLLYSLFGLFLTLLFPFSLLYLFYKGSKDIPKHASISILALSCLFVISSVFNLPLSSFEGDFFAGSFFFLQSFFVSFLLISFVLRKRVQVVSFHSLFFGAVLDNPNTTKRRAVRISKDGETRGDSRKLIRVF